MVIGGAAIGITTSRRADRLSTEHLPIPWHTAVRGSRKAIEGLGTLLVGVVAVSVFGVFLRTFRLIVEHPEEDLVRPPSRYLSKPTDESAWPRVGRLVVVGARFGTAHAVSRGLTVTDRSTSR
jgi:hypothetical protein